MSTTDFKTLNEDLNKATETNSLRDASTVQQQVTRIWNTVREENDNAWALYVKGRILMMMRKPPPLAMLCFQKALQLDATFYQAMSKSGTLLSMVGNPQEALVMLRRAEETARDDNTAPSKDVAQCAFDVGFLLQVMGDIQEAEHAYERAIQADAMFMQAYMTLSVVQDKQGKFDDALETLDRGLVVAREQDGDVLLCVIAKGAMYSRRNEWQQALEIFSEALPSHPEDWRLLAKIIQCNVALGDTNEQEENIRKLYKLYEDGKVDSDRFCREQISTEHGIIHVLEMFQDSYEFGHSLIQMKWASTPPLQLPAIVSLGSYDSTNNISRELGTLPATHRLYHIDAYGVRGEHKTLEFIQSEKRPLYNDIRQRMLDGMLGKAKPKSSFTLPTANRDSATLNLN